MSLFMTKGGKLLPNSMVIVAIVVALAGCVSRPTADVLKPVTLKTDQQKKVSILAVTNRDPVAKDASFGNRWAGSTSYDQFSFSVPAKRDGPNIQYVSKNPDPNRQYIVTGRERLTKTSLVQMATSTAQFDGTAAVFVHGYNYSYQEALFRTAQMAADSGSFGAPIMFSWPSAASVTGYVADRDAVLYSRTELGSLLETLAAAPKVKRIILFGHSMGGFLSMEAARQLRLEGRSNVLSKLQIVLAAPDIDVDVFRSQIRDVGAIPTPITLLVSNSDQALSFSSFVGGERPRVGSLDVNDPVIQRAAKAENIRVIDISALKSSDGLGHDRYASLAQFAGNIDKAEARMRSSGTNIGAFVFDAAGAAVASPFRLAGQIARQ
ncbi:alpha/beta hydrolase [Agrobacterium rubi]|nr:alpha/beta fold hydrolase [Agrobacterium rubi]